jgi:hypothetical protein
MWWEAYEGEHAWNAMGQSRPWKANSNSHLVKIFPPVTLTDIHCHVNKIRPLVHMNEVNNPEPCF